MMNRRTFWLLAPLALLAIHTGAAAGGTLLTFDTLKNFEQVGNYYDGGMGSLGSGPGPNFGVTFSSQAFAYVPGEQSGTVTPFPGDPSPPTVLLLGDFTNGFAQGAPLTMTMDVAGGFGGALIFYDLAIVRAATVTIWSGLDGTGTQLAQLSLTLVPVTSEVFSAATALSFAGTAHSVVFAGGNDQLALDNISFQSVPEPTSWLLLALGLGSSVVFLRGRRHPNARVAGIG
jgi:hypothetical protein